MKDSERIKILKPTANAIFDIAKKLGMINEISRELSECSLLFEDTAIRNYFLNKRVPKKEKVELLEKKLKPILSNEVYTFVSLLAEHDTIDILPHIVDLYKELVDEHNNTIRVKIVTSEKVDDDTIKSIIDTIKCFSNSNIEYTTELDSSILGGIIVTIGSVVYDYSIKNQINKLQNKFING